MKKDIDVLTPALPPYHVVASSRTLGFDRPEDSLWKEIAKNSPHFSRETLPCGCAERIRRGSEWSHLKACRQIEVFIHRCMFNHNGISSVYRIGQCPACRTVYWSED